MTVTGARVTGVLDGTPAAAAGLSVGDELVAIDGWRVAGDADARTAIAAHRVGDELAVALFRRGRLVTTTVTLAAAPPARFELGARADAPAAAQARYQRWLGEPYPAGEVLATVIVTNRAL